MVRPSLLSPRHSTHLQWHTQEILSAKTRKCLVGYQFGQAGLGIRSCFHRLQAQVPLQGCSFRDVLD